MQRHCQALKAMLQARHILRLGTCQDHQRLLAIQGTAISPCYKSFSSVFSSNNTCSSCQRLLNSNNGQHVCTRSLSADQTLGTSPQTLPQATQAVICGGGVTGLSIAYHLAKEGWKDIVLLEQGSLGCGTSWHAAGLIGQLRSSTTESQISTYSAKLYKQFEDEGYSTGWKNCGSLHLARTKDRVTAFHRLLMHSRQLGLEGEFITPDQCKDRVPQLSTEGLQGGLMVSADGVVNPTDLVMAFAKKSKELGVKILEKCSVSRVITHGRQVIGVDTSLGSINCNVFVNAGGMWARELGQLSNPPVRVPLHPCEHFYLVTKPIAGVDPMMPVVRDYDGYVYMREFSGGILAGGFEPVAKPVFHKGIPDKFEFQLLPEDWDQFQIMLDEILRRMPCLQDAQVRHLTNGPESFTPDAKCILGRAPELENYYIAAGMNSTGIAFAGGVGKLMAEWIAYGEPNMNLWPLDVRRFVDLHNNMKFLRDRVTETLGKHSAPEAEETFHSSRGISTTPLHRSLESAGARFRDLAGTECAFWFTSQEAKSPDGEEEENMTLSGVFGCPPWFEEVKSEYWACRTGVCLIDMSTFTKFELRSAGDEVVEFLQYVCSNDVDRAVGSVIHTGIQNHQGGYENDCSMVRLEDNRYFMISPTAQHTRSWAWLQDHMPKDGSVQISDMTSMYTAINVIGPKAPELLGELTDTPLSKQDFLHMTCKDIDVGHASGIRAMRLTHTGEEGWMLYIPSEFALHVYDSLMKVGENYGIKNAGYYALRALRTEKFFAYWGTDLMPNITPLECGREYRVKLESGGFIGCQALMQQKASGIKKRLVQFLLEDHNPFSNVWPWGGEPIFRNGQFCGSVTSASYGFTLGKHICLGYVQDIDQSTGETNYITNDFIFKDAKFTINIAGKSFACKAAIYPPKLPPAGVVLGSDKK